jgi:hypothetical protein
MMPDGDDGAALATSAATGRSASGGVRIVDPVT